MNELKNAAAEVGLSFANNTIWTGTNGRRAVRGYRFFRRDPSGITPDWHQGGEIHTASGRKAAADYIKAYAQGWHASREEAFKMAAEDRWE